MHANVFCDNLQVGVEDQGTAPATVCLDIDTDDRPLVAKILIEFECEEDGDITLFGVRVTKCGEEICKYCRLQSRRSESK